MATNSTIEWTTRTWNPVLGCSMTSPGCAHCYAERMSNRLAGMAKADKNPGRRAHYLHVINGKGRWNGHLEPVEEALEEPMSWNQPSTVFVNSMSDLFHESVEAGFIARVFDVMNRADRHQFQVLTKRSKRLRTLSPQLPWSPNIWQGVSVENADYSWRVDDLRQTEVRIKFLSVEPLLGPLGAVNLSGIDWVIVGGESGPGCRPMKIEWVREIRDQCLNAGVRFFFKQHGHLKNNPDKTDPTAKENGGHSKGGRMLDGRTWDEMPTVAQSSPVTLQERSHRMIQSFASSAT